MPDALDHVAGTPLAAYGDGERQASTGNLAFEPYSEPLGPGDTVQWENLTGCVVEVTPEHMCVTFQGGGSTAFFDMKRRGSLRLLEKASVKDPPAEA